MDCSLKSCDSSLSLQEDRIEVCSRFNRKAAQKFKVNWKLSGDAVFHLSCWEKLLKASRCRNVKNDPFKLSILEKNLIKEASKTAERFDNQSKIKEEAKRVAKMISTAKHCCVFTGAGISTSAGIGDYRGKKGKWTQMDQEEKEVLTEDEPCIKRFKESKQESNTSGENSDEELENDGVPYETLRPTYTHEAIVKLMELGHIKYVISQNGDGLHLLSGIDTDKISELHGNVFVEYCEKCGKRYHRKFYVMDDSASQYYEDIQEYGSTDIKKPLHAKKCQLCQLCHRTGRKCDQKVCNGFLNDTIINFRDNLEESVLNKAIENAEKCDLMLSLGTTMTVTPACDLVEMGKEPLKIVICNRQKTPIDDVALKVSSVDNKPIGSRIFGDCDVFLQYVMENLLPSEDLKKWESERGQRIKACDQLRDTS